MRLLVISVAEILSFKFLSFWWENRWLKSNEKSDCFLSRIASGVLSRFFDFFSTIVYKYNQSSLYFLFQDVSNRSIYLSCLLVLTCHITIWLLHVKQQDNLHEDGRKRMIYSCMHICKLTAVILVIPLLFQGTRWKRGWWLAAILKSRQQQWFAGWWRGRSNFTAILPPGRYFIFK